MQFPLLEHGNGTKTMYKYEPDRRRLKHMTAQTKAKYSSRHVYKEMIVAT